MENRTLYEIMWENIVQTDRTQKAIYYDACAFHAGYLRLQTHTPEYVILIPLLQQQWLHERASVSRYAHFVCLVVTAKQF